ncbi:MAG: flagellar hook protein FlgE [Burkholderiales bacterium]|nr:flagellar hook protein FlgE [Burkholderiales bacterium]
MSFQHGLSGLSAAAKNLDVIGNNVANANTVGAKSSRAEFADLYANSLTGLSAATTGIGVAVSGVAQQFTQGDIVATQNPLDMAINGRGFFRVSQEGVTQYTRNGQFRMDKDGYIVTAQGARLTGYQIDATGVVSNGTPTDLRISTADISPRATASARAQLNLDARDTPITAPFNSASPTTYHSAMSMSVYDSLGRDHQVTLFYRKTAGNSWEVRASADGTDIPGVAATLNFSSAGLGTSPTGPFNLTIPVGADAGNSMTFGIDLTNATQFGASFATTEITQDGYGTGRLSGFTADDSGMLIGRYSNGQTRPQGQIVLANFVNPQGLVPLGNNAWVEGAGAGQPTLGAPGSGILGSLEAGAVENSNVDLTAELVNMITAQRVYQANAQTIKTHDQLLQTIVNLR